jgi:hypothetical protein
MSANAHGKDPWPRLSLVPRRRGRAPAGRRLSPAEVAAETERLKAEGKLDPVPVVSGRQAIEEAKNG